MNQRIRIVILCLISLYLGPMIWTGNTWAEESVRVAMIVWRGETAAERGFKHRLSKSTDYNVNFDVFNADKNKGNLKTIIENLDLDKYDLIYTFGTTVTKTVKKAIKDKPVIFNIVSRPVKSGIIRSWESSGSNLTGASNVVPMDSAFKTLALVLQIRKLGFIYNINEVNSKIQKLEMEKQNQKFGFVIVDAPINSVETIPETLKVILDAKPDAVMFPSDSLVKSNADALITVLNKHKIPTIVTIPDMVKENKALLALGPDYFQLGSLAAENALLVLKGEAPSNIPIRRVESLRMTIHLETADKLEVGVPIQILSMSNVIR